ncbi:aspartic proteinase nepenthesin-2 [Phtheirospermum japonicum]|uniref:Aspartic proteinase nepenthesin-2 n=1 Tax=Phtheirospermum japonicum TaxID=374723 RepID=A0A830AXG8_9LAMI|nr:aspartic proteinase nepenthesin-2 [Phtheirospermum japonicum]
MKQNLLTRILIVLSIIFFHKTAPRAKGFRLKLVPWDSPNSPLYPGKLTPLEKYQRIVGSLHHHLNSTHLNSTINLNEIQFPVEHQEDFRYSVDVKIGTPGTYVKLLVDTDGSFMWTQCLSTTHPPLSSKTYKKLPCNHRLCPKQFGKCIQKQCVYTIPDKLSGAKFKLAGSVDKFHIPGSKSQLDIVFGCSTRQYRNLSGILGLDRTPVSLLSQLGKKSGGGYSYCLHKGDSYLTLGEDISSVGKKVKTTPLIHNDHSTFLNLTDISVNGKRLGLSPSLFTLKNGGGVMDTGRPYTMLTKKAYDKVNKAFQRHFKGKLKMIHNTYWNLKPCYRLPAGFNKYPNMTFHFEGADLETEHTTIYEDTMGVACMGVTRGRRTVIGAVQQWDTKFMFDINKNVVKFYRDDCKDDTKE